MLRNAKKSQQKKHALRCITKYISIGTKKSLIIVYNADDN